MKNLNVLNVSVVYRVVYSVANKISVVYSVANKISCGELMLEEHVRSHASNVSTES